MYEFFNINIKKIACYKIIFYVCYFNFFTKSSQFPTFSRSKICQKRMSQLFSYLPRINVDELGKKAKSRKSKVRDFFFQLRTIFFPLHRGHESLCTNIDELGKMQSCCEFECENKKIQNPGLQIRTIFFFFFFFRWLRT